MKADKPHSTFTGLAGEFFVAAELLKRGYLALVTMGNTKRVDIIATNSEGTKTVRIQVKSEKSKAHQWVLTAKAETEYADDLFYVLVSLGKPDERPDFFVVPSAVVAKRVRQNHKEWLDTPGRNGVAHRDNPMRKFDKYDGYQDAWDKLGL